MITTTDHQYAHLTQAQHEQQEAGCPHGTDIAYDPGHDAYYCPSCDIWLEPLCDDSDCPFCTDVPLRPSLSQ